tara:strand:+ start:7975 stop:8361 length:387 start_codon:yes stop_codon:yes gene_type:complete
MKKLYLILFILIILVACNRSEKTRILEDEHVVEYLKKNGDKLVKPREVFHWIYFKTELEADNFIKETENKNFIFVSKRKVEDNYPIQVELKRIDKVDIKSVNEYSLYLLEIAEKYNGDYDGWETSVEK